MSPPLKTTTQLEELYHYSEAISRTNLIDEIYQESLKTIKRILEVNKASILLLEQDGLMHFKAWLNLSRSYRAAVDGHSPWSKDTKNPKPVLIPDVKKDKSLGHLKKIILSEGIQAFAFFPLILKKKLIGKFMIYYGAPHVFKEEEIQLAEVIGKHISFAIHKKESADEFLNALTDGVFVFDTNFKTIYINKAGAVNSGYSSLEEMIKKPLKWRSNLEIRDETGLPIPLEELPGRKALREKKSFQTVLQYKNLKTGEIRWVIDKSSPIFDEKGQVRCIIAIAHDITERMELEKRKDEFISTASHELRTPISTIKGYAQIIVHKAVKDDVRYYAEQLDKQVDRLSALVSDLLDVSRIKNNKLKLNKQKFNMVEMVEEIAKDFQLIAPTHQIEIKNGIAKKYVKADKDKIYEVLNNLLSNAIKFSPKSKKVILKILNSRKQMVVSVKDFGIGVSNKYLNRVFEPFFQPTNKIRQSFSGLGLGLYISSQIVKQHDGKMWVKSERGKGSEFTFSIPIN